MRHNALRDLEAELMEEVCRDVKIEPELLPLGKGEFKYSEYEKQSRQRTTGCVRCWSMGKS